MRTLLATVASSLFVILAAIAAADPAWWLALLGLAAVWLLWALGEKERRREHRYVKLATFDAIEALYASEQSAQAPNDADQD